MRPYVSGDKQIVLYLLLENLAARIPPGSCVTMVARKYAVWKKDTYWTPQSVRW